MKRTIAFLAVGFGLCLSAASAHASHIFSQNITINGTPVAVGNGFTDPLIVVANPGDNVTFSFELFSTGGDPDTFNVTFGPSSGTLGPPANASFAYNGSGTAGTPVLFSFTRSFGSPGLYDGFLIPDFPVSFPDYIFPGGGQLSEPQIPFRIQVNPEPASLLAWGLLTGVGFVSYRLRRRKVSA